MLDGEVPLTYTGGWLDRAGGLRADPDWTAARRGAAARIVPLWRDRCLIAGDPPVPVRLDGAAGAGILDAGAEPVFLGLADGVAVFAVDLSALPEQQALAVAGAERAADVRTIVGGLAPAEAALQAYARGLLYWHRGQGFCGACGGPTRVRDGGQLRVCAGADCGRLLFPRIEPAVIVLVEAPGDPNRCLLARHRGAGPDGFSLIAGFVEVGESLEDAVRREAAEEAGIRLASVRYRASQAWPFPAGLMVGFTAVAATEEVTVDGVELVDARWFTRDQLRERAAAGHPPGRDDSIDRLLFTGWLSDQD
ncbi:NAD(+) diphosphatase [Plantactinospora sp. KBS50]|uniref:NAD(+) diphosphatase n=1 Tax=Plantactinospora sp. KBS50 TaxID=2024580 RepID=UPI001E5F9634|nr:NAD(+) diphosphatase [Plantactinospora sp. KBS50]